MLLLTVIVVIVFLWFQFVFSPLDEKVKAGKAAISALNGEMGAFGTEMTLLEERLKVDPNQSLRDEHARLKLALKVQRDELESKLSALIAPERMADVLRDVLAGFSGLTLRSARNYQVRPFSVRDGQAQEKQAQEGRAKGKYPPEEKNGSKDSAVEKGELPIYQHSFELSLVGNFFDLLRYLKRLEGLDEDFQWYLLDIRVNDYPQMEVRVVVRTLSLEQEWIGV